MGSFLKTMSARAAKNGFGTLMDAAMAGPVTIEKHGRPAVVVLSVEQYQRLCESAHDKQMANKPSNMKAGGKIEVEAEDISRKSHK